MVFDYGSSCPECGYPKPQHSVGCALRDDVARFEKAKKKEMVRIVTKRNNWFDMEIPKDFDMLAYITSVRAMGYILNHRMYMPVEEIECIFLWSEQPTGSAQGVVLPFPAPEKPAS